LLHIVNIRNKMRINSLNEGEDKVEDSRKELSELIQAYEKQIKQLYQMKEWMKGIYHEGEVVAVPAELMFDLIDNNIRYAEFIHNQLERLQKNV
jgi:hypothetical protein